LEPREQNIEALLTESRRFEPSPEFREAAIVNDPAIYEEAAQDLEGFWAKWAEELDWFEKWDKVLEWDAPDVTWFEGGKLNASYNCLDRHLDGPRKNKAAIIWEGEYGETVTLTYQQLHDKVNRFANVLKDLGVKKGDRVTMYLPMIPELPIAMLACARIGAPHSVVFGGFSPAALAHRVNDAGSKLVITCDGYYRRGGVVPQKQRTDEGLADCPGVEKVVVVSRLGEEIEMTEGRDLWWDDLMAEASPKCPPEHMDAEDMLFMMYTSGTTGRPKGVIHTTGGYMTGAYTTMKLVFDLKETDTYWCTADIGWITGHSYIVYGPLANGATTVMYEGAPDFPDRGRMWDMVERLGVTIFYTAPTAIRAFMRWGNEWPAKYDLSSLRLLGTVGEPINPEAWIWYNKSIGNDECPIVDTWWQTETGMIMITPLPGISITKPGSASRPFPGVQADVLDLAGEPVPPGTGGYLAISTPWPAMFRGIWGDEERYREYWTRYPGYYYPADGARIDEDGDFWVMGRIDDVMNVSGHRLSTMELESALVEHPAVAEAAVIGAAHELKGQTPIAFVILEEGQEPTDELKLTLRKHVGTAIGPIARPEEIIFSDDLPKTRSGKIMRRLLKSIAAGEELGDTTTLRNPEVAEELRERYMEMKKAD